MLYISCPAWPRRRSVLGISVSCRCYYSPYTTCPFSLLTLRCIPSLRKSRRPISRARISSVSSTSWVRSSVSAPSPVSSWVSTSAARSTAGTAARSLLCLSYQVCYLSSLDCSSASPYVPPWRIDCSRPCHFLRNYDAVMLLVYASAVNTAGLIPIYYTPLYFQFTRGDSAIEAAVRLLPLISVLSAQC